MRLNAFQYSYGMNQKIGDDTLIFNMGASADCPSAKLGLCPLSKICYAKKREKQFPKRVLVARRYQQEYWLGNTAKTIARDIGLAIEKHSKHGTPVTFVRFNESGDFWSQACVKKLSDVAKALPKIIFYGYTHRSDLNYTKRPKNLIIQGSGWNLDNEFRSVSKELFASMKESKPNRIYKCLGACQGCMLCKTAGNKTILVAVH